MSEDLAQLVVQYKNRSQILYYFLAFIGGFFVIWIPIFTVTDPSGLNRLYFVLWVGPLSTVGLIIFLFITYTIIKDTTKSRLRRRLDQELVLWKMQAIEDTIRSIETVAPVPLMNIETYSHNYLYHKFATEYPSLNLQKLRIVFPNTVYILQQLLAQKPYLGIYYQVEQQFVKNLIGESKI